jgi:hypothetical protein
MRNRLPLRLHILGLLSSLLLGSIAWQSQAAPNNQNVYLPLIAVPPPVHFERIMPLRTHLNDSYAEGEVVSDTIRPLYDLAIEATFISGSEPKQTTTTTAVTAFPATLPGHRNAFRTDFVTDTSTSWFILRADAKRWEITSPRDYRAITIVTVQPCAEAVRLLCVELKNDYPRTLQKITILLGDPIYPYGYEWGTFADSLVSQASRVYRIQKPNRPDFNAADWITSTWVEAQGELVP